MKNMPTIPVHDRPRARLFPAVLAVTALFGLSACEETRHEISKALGLEKPDFNESEVMTGEPLAIPPDFDLRPPGSGEELYYPSADLGAPAAAVPQGIPVQQQQPYQQPYQGAYPAQPAYGAYPAQPAYGTYPAQPAYGQAPPQAIPQSGAQNVFAQATQAYGRANTGGYAATPSGAYNYGGTAQPYPQPYGGQPVYSQQPYAQQPYAGQPGAQNVSGYQGQSQVIPPVANSDAAAPSQECDDVVVDVLGNYVCK